MEKIFDEWSSYIPGPLTAENVKDRAVVLLTGSSGSLGSFLHERLVSSPYVEKVICLNRGTNAQSRQMRSYEHKGLSRGFQLAIFLHGRISKQCLGLGEDTFTNLLHEVTHVIHDAWEASLNRPLDSYVPYIRGVNHLIDTYTTSTCNAYLLFLLPEPSFLPASRYLLRSLSRKS